MFKYFLITALFLIGIIGCENSSEPTGEYGTLRMYLVDLPSTFDSVVVSVRQVQVHSAGNSNTGWYVINDSLRSFDLLQLMNGASAVLGDSVLPAGKYAS